MRLLSKIKALVNEVQPCRYGGPLPWTTYSSGRMKPLPLSPMRNIT